MLGLEESARDLPVRQECNAAGEEPDSAWNSAVRTLAGLTRSRGCRSRTIFVGFAHGESRGERKSKREIKRRVQGYRGGGKGFLFSHSTHHNTHSLGSDNCLRECRDDPPLTPPPSKPLSGSILKDRPGYGPSSPPSFPLHTKWVASILVRPRFMTMACHGLLVPLNGLSFERRGKKKTRRLSHCFFASSLNGPDGKRGPLVPS